MSTEACVILVMYPPYWETMVFHPSKETHFGLFYNAFPSFVCALFLTVCLLSSRCASRGEGCGKLKQTRSVKVKGQKERATEEYYVYGWKVLVLIDVHTRLPLAMKVVKIEEYEGRWLVPLLEQAQRNLGTHGRIRTIVIDRGYLDGEDLWQVHQLGVLFVVVGKANMVVTQDAQALAKGERGQARE